MIERLQLSNVTNKMLKSVYSKKNIYLMTVLKEIFKSLCSCTDDVLTLILKPRQNEIELKFEVLGMLGGPFCIPTESQGSRHIASCRALGD
jgi:hypothetical protein